MSGGDGKCDNVNLVPKCIPCRTINLARVKELTRKPDMQIYQKCVPQNQPCLPVQEMHCQPACIKVCDKEEYLKCTCKQTVRPIVQPVGHGPFFYIVKAAILGGVILFTYQQGVWGKQQETYECYLRWTEYLRSLNTRHAPNFDKCGKVIVKEGDSIAIPLYSMYKSFVTSIFQGIVKFPMIVKCMYLDYVEKMRLMEIEKAKKIK